MSDIGFHGLDMLILVFVGFCFLGPSLVLGVLVLGAGIFIARPRTLLAVYVGLSTLTTGIVLTWLSDWQNMPEMGTWAFPIGLGIAISGWGLFALSRLILGKVTGKKAGINA